MNKSPIEKYQESVRNLTDAVEEKRNEIIIKLQQERNIVASEAELARKVYESKLQELKKIDKDLRDLQQQGTPSKVPGLFRNETVGRHYDSKYDEVYNNDVPSKSKNNYSFSRILAIRRKKR